MVTISLKQYWYELKKNLNENNQIIFHVCDVEKETAFDVSEDELEAVLNGHEIECHGSVEPNLKEICKLLATDFGYIIHFDKPVAPSLIDGKKWNQTVYGNNTIYLNNEKIIVSKEEAETLRKYAKDLREYEKLTNNLPHMNVMEFRRGSEVGKEFIEMYGAFLTGDEKKWLDKEITKDELYNLQLENAKKHFKKIAEVLQLKDMD